MAVEEPVAGVVGHHVQHLGVAGQQRVPVAAGQQVRPSLRGSVLVKVASLRSTSAAWHYLSANASQLNKWRASIFQNTELHAARIIVSVVRLFKRLKQISTTHVAHWSTRWPSRSSTLPCQCALCRSTSLPSTNTYQRTLGSRTQSLQS